SHPATDTGFADEFLGFWQQKRVGYLIGEAPKALEEALNGIMRMARTVRELKEFAGVPESSWGPADLNRALENTVAVSRQVWSSVADVTLELDRNLPPLVCDITALKQAFFDILMAAIERAPRPALAARSAGAPRAVGSNLQLTIRSRHLAGAIEIQFRDNGPGLPAELEQGLRGSIAPPELLELMDGQGLGMAYSVVAVQHQGQLLDQSAPGQGATLVVRLPEGMASPRAREFQAAAPAHATPRS